MTNDEMVEKAKFEELAKSLWPNIAIFATCQECGPWHYEDGLTQKLWESWKAAARSAVRDAVRECADAETIKEVIEEHETNYQQQPLGGWKWSCQCGQAMLLTSREFCVDMTRSHWADSVASALREKFEVEG